MNKENSLAITGGMNLPGLMRDAFDSLDAMSKVADMLLSSRTIPDHFYEKGGDNKPDYTKGKTHAVAAVLIKGYDLGIKPMTALQSIIPINGLLSLKVDLMKAMIFSSGTMAPGGWIEKIDGSLDVGNYKVSITGKRKNGLEMTRSFSIAEAKKAGLWITQEMLQGKDGWKYKNSAWNKYGTRMIGLRAAGFLCRDLWGDVIDNSVSYEEARDYPEDTTIIIETANGVEAKIPDKQFAEERSGKLTGSVIDKIDKGQSVLPSSPGVSEFPDPVDEPHANVPPPFEPDPPQESDGLPEQFHWTYEKLKETKSKELELACATVPLTLNAMNLFEGKNTNKKLRDIIAAYQNGTLEAMVNKVRRGSDEGAVTKAAQETASSIPPTTAPLAEGGMEFAEAIEGDEVEPNYDFEDGVAGDTPEDETPEANAASSEGTLDGTKNKFDIEIPSLEEGGRDFPVMLPLYQAITKAGVDDTLFGELNVKILAGKYKNLEELCRHGTSVDINMLLNSVE